MSVDKSFSGNFWVAGDLTPRLAGVLQVGPGRAPEVDVEGELTPGLVAMDGEAAEDGANVTHFVPARNETFSGPVLVHGLDDAGVPVTLVDAATSFRTFDLLGTEDRARHRLRGNQAVVGGHLSDRNHQFVGLRIRIQNMDNWRPLLGRQEWVTRVPLNGAGTAALENVPDSGVWFTASSIGQRDLRDLDRSFIRPLISLFSLATSRTCELLGFQVQDSASQEWWDVYSSSQRPDSDLGDPMPSSWLLRSADLQMCNIKAWLDQVNDLGPLPSVIADLTKAATISLETQVLQVTTIAEGLHRALFPDEKRMDEETAENVRRAAIEAVKDIHPKAASIVGGLLQHLVEPGYGPRLQKLVEDVGDAVPGVTGQSTSKWKAMVNKARNDFAHRFSAGFFESDDVDNYLTTAISLRWLLTGLLLRRAEVSSCVLAARFADSGEYQTFLQYAQLWKPSVYGPQPGNG